MTDRPSAASGGLPAHRPSASGGMAAGAASAASGGVGAEDSAAGGAAAAAEAGPVLAPDSLLATVFRAIGLVLQRKDVIEKKIKIGRDKMVNDLEVVQRLVGRIHQELQRSPLAPVEHCKDLASNGYILHRVLKVVASEKEEDDYAKILIQGMSSRRIIFEIEDCRDKEGLNAAFETAMAELKTLIEALAPPKPAKSNEPNWRRKA